MKVTESARTWLAEKGYDRLYGARPMARMIQQKVKEPLSEELLFGKLEHGGTAEIDLTEDNIIIKCYGSEAEPDSGAAKEPGSGPGEKTAAAAPAELALASHKPAPDPEPFPVQAPPAKKQTPEQPQAATPPPGASGPAPPAVPGGKPASPGNESAAKPTDQATSSDGLPINLADEIIKDAGN